MILRHVFELRERIGRDLVRLRMKYLDRSRRVVLGAAGFADKGWMATDQDRMDILSEGDWCRHFRPASVDAILAEHVWEHLTEAQGLAAARYCFAYLRPGGYARIAVPDGLHPDPAYVEAVRPGGSGPGADDHKVLYTHATLGAMFEKAGFEVQPLEYFDAAGQFHAEAWNPADGTIRRSLRFDPRNREGKPNYTSIVIDARKPLGGV